MSSRVAVLVSLGALWPVGAWWWRRFLTEETPWTPAIALLVAAGVFMRDRRRDDLDPAWLRAASVAMVVYAGAAVLAPPLSIGVLAALALGLVLAAATREPGRSLGLMLLLLASLPIESSLQFFLGFPMRAVSAELAATLLRGAGWSVTASGALLEHGGRALFVDPACSGLRFLASGLLLAAMLSAGLRLDVKRTLALAACIVPAALVANALRTSALFLLQNSPAQSELWLHEGVGMASFMIVVLGLCAAALVSARKAPR